MADVSIMLNGRSYDIACDDGQEERIMDLAHYVDTRLKEISRSGAASNEVHSLILTLLVLADEVFDLRDNISVLGENVAPEVSAQADELVIAEYIEKFAGRINGIADRIQKA